MNIPLDRLYHYIENIAQEIYGERVIIYRFWPHGSKNVNNLNFLRVIDTWYKKLISPLVWCNDQEPLDYEFYKTYLNQHLSEFNNLLKSLGKYSPPTNLNYHRGIFEKGLLLHSEKRSKNLKKYQLDNELIPIYYWSHAVIARDWFRYAEHEIFKKSTKKTFLIYNRAWSGTREYRLRFFDLLINHGLADQCQSSVNAVEPELGIHYSLHKFKNPQWRLNTVLENFFPINNAHSNSSADFDTIDYNSTDIEVVLETLFDDDRLHLTEKSLRPIACNQPFILAGTHGSLDYLRSYGFKTFDTVWDESYDQIADPEVRLKAIVALMQQIFAWDGITKNNKLVQAQAIADYNRQWFFSQNFFDLVINELTTNLKLAFDELEQCNNYQPWIDRWQKLITYPEINDFLKTNQDMHLPTEESVEFVMKLAQTRLAEVANKNKS
jgi:uncharacterized protein YeaO (DUF488 family)